MDDILYCCKMTEVTPTSDITLELLYAYEFEFSSWLDKECDTTVYTIYCESRKSAKSTQRILQEASRQWTDFGIEINNVELLDIKKEDWSEVWKKYFKIEHITDKLVIKPSWLDYNKRDDEIILKIDPGMSFGTGKHPTTAFCLRCIEKLSSKTNIKSFIDVGCGSGILSIAAFQLGYKPISAFDIDPDSIIVAKENFSINDTPLSAINLQIADIANIESKTTYDLVNVNILAHILLQNKENILKLTKPNGYLILSGILSTEYCELRNAFCELGIKEIDSYIDKEWQSGLFRI